MDNLTTLIYQNAVTYKRRIALKLGRRKVTYDMFNRLTNQAAHGLEQQNIGSGSRVGILLNNSIEYVIAYFGILKTCAMVVPLNNFLKAAELTYIINDCELTLLITEKSFEETINALKAKFPKLVVIYLEDDTAELSWSDLIINQPQTNLNHRISPNQVSTILYTSGTTGHPKGAMLSHANLLANASSCKETVLVSQKDRFLLFLPMFHSFTFTITVILPLLSGARTVILPSVRPFKKVIKALLFERITGFVAVPAVYTALCTARLPWYVLPLMCVRCFVSGGAALPVATWENFEKRFKAPLLEGYGLTEAAPAVTFNSIVRKRKGGSIGQPIANVEVKIVDDEGVSLPPDTPGELLVRGPNVMLGYLNFEEATALAIRGGWLYTGDIATRDEEGYYYIVDRKKDMIIVRGLNVYPREVEEVLHRHPAVKEAAVVGLHDSVRGEIPKAYVVAVEGERLSHKELRRYCSERLADYKVPHHYEIRTDLPKTSTGKVLKRQLIAEESSQL